MTTTPKTSAPKSTAAKPEADAFAFPSMPAMEVPPALRDMAETSLNQSKEAYSKFKSAAEDTSAMMEETIAKTRDGIVKFNSKALETAQENTDATLAHIKNVFAVKSLSEAIELQSAFVKAQMNAMQDQVKTFQDLATKLAQETSAPYKAAFTKSVETFKAD